MFFHITQVMILKNKKKRLKTFFEKGTIVKTLIFFFLKKNFLFFYIKIS